MGPGLFQKKLAGVPVWLWALIIIGALVIAVMRKAKTTAPVESTQASQPVVLSYQDTSIPPPSLPSPSSNEEWRRTAFGVLMALGYDPYSVRHALNRYLIGRSVSPSDSAYIAAANARVGAPPQELGTPVVGSYPPDPHTDL